MICRYFRRNNIIAMFWDFGITAPSLLFSLFHPLSLDQLDMNANIICNGQLCTISRLPRRRVRLEVNHLKLKARPQRWSNSYSTKSSLTAQKVIFSGIQPTGVPHLGNYLGALREWGQLQNNATEETKLLFSIVDLHALTVPQDASQLRKWRKEMFATLLSVGLNPERSTIFYQSAVGDIENIRILKYMH